MDTNDLKGTQCNRPNCFAVPSKAKDADVKQWKKHTPLKSTPQMMAHCSLIDNQSYMNDNYNNNQMDPCDHDERRRDGDFTSKSITAKAFSDECRAPSPTPGKPLGLVVETNAFHADSRIGRVGARYKSDNNTLLPT